MSPLPVLVLEDDAATAELLEEILLDLDYAPLVVDSLDAVPASFRPFVVVSDLVTMRSYSLDAAVAAVTELRARFGRIPLMLLTAHMTASADRHKLDVDAVIAKPFDIGVLVAMLQRAARSAAR